MAVTSGRAIARNQEWRVAKITEVNPATNHIAAQDQYGTNMLIDVTGQSPLLQVPVVGELWTVSRRGSDWILERRYESSDTNLPFTQLNPGDVRVDNSGTFYITGDLTVGKHIAGVIPVFNVKDKIFGAIGDGSTDDSSAIRAADLAASAVNGILYFPLGTYKCQALQLASKIIMGVPGGGTILQLASGAITPVILNGGFTSGVTIQDLTFDCQSQTNSIGIAVGPNGLTDMNISRCQFINAKYGINGTNSGWTFNWIDIFDCTFATGNWGILFNNVNLTYLSVQKSRFKGGTTGSGIDLNVPSAGSLNNITLNNNRITGYSSSNTNAGFGIDIAGQTSALGTTNIIDVTVQGNTIDNTNGEGVHIEGSCVNVAVNTNTINNTGGPGIMIVSLVTSGPPLANITVVGNTVRNCGSSRTVTGAGIAVTNSTTFQGVNISGNTVRGCGNASTLGRGINVQAAGRANVSNNLVSNTVGSDSTTSGIAVLGSATATPIVQGNRCWDDGPGTQFFGLRVSTTIATIGINDFSGNVTGRYSWNTGSASGDSVLADTGSPAGVIPAAVGCVYKRLDGGGGTTLYVKESGTSTSGWIASRGSLLSNTIVLNGTTSYVAPSAAISLFIEGIGGGGSGAGCAASGASALSGAGSGSGGNYAEAALTSNIGTHVVAVGAGGAAPSAGAVGNNGGDSSLKDTLSNNIVVAKGGLGGNVNSQLAGGTTANASGDIAGNSGDTGDLTIQAVSGTRIIRISGTFGYETDGGGHAPRGGPSGRTVTSNSGGSSFAGVFPGGAGSGVIDIANTARSGGAGANGVLMVKAYG